MKIENMLQRFSCISFLFKPPCYSGNLMGIFTECNNLNDNFARSQPIAVVLFKFFLMANESAKRL